jgi:hypothetical protein
VLWLIFTAVLLLLVVRSRFKKRGRAATGKDALAAARVQGEFASYDCRPHRVDPVTGTRDWGQ